LDVSSVVSESSEYLIRTGAKPPVKLGISPLTRPLVVSEN
jgi:hypothetical protein